MAMVILAASLAAPAMAAQIGGSKGTDVLRGTASADTIRGRAGDDTLRGRGGDDLLIGGRGADAMAGGPGTDRCETDAADPAPRGCEDVRGPAGPLTLRSVTGADHCLVLRRADLCFFALAGSGADAATGTISTAGAVELTSEPDRVTVRRGDWDAYGTYACDGDGALAVTIAGESVSAPVDC